MNKLNKHLKTFQTIFSEDKVKSYPTKLEYRGIANLEQAIAQANRIIKHNGLMLHVVSSGQLASYKAFEVHEGTGKEAVAA